MNQPLNVKPTPPNTTYTHDVDNRLLTAGDVSFGYDDNGNLTTKTLGSNVTNYSWDFNDMLTQVTANGNTYIYRYDALGNRVAKIENSVEKRYVFDLAETDASGNITAYYVYGLGLISKITPSDESYFYHFDGLGSTIAITDSSGNVVNKYSYDEYGKVLNQEEAIPNPFKYVGRFGVMDEGNGLLYMRARFYDPEVGRFISKDPIGFAGGDLNLYAYVANDPINFVDPSGLVIDTIADIGFIIWDIYELITDPCNRGENLTALGLDVAGAFIPFATGLGKGYKVGKKGLTSIAKNVNFGDMTTKVVGKPKKAIEEGFVKQVVNIYDKGEYIGTIHQVVDPTTKQVIHRDFERIIYKGVDYRR